MTCLPYQHPGVSADDKHQMLFLLYRKYFWDGRSQGAVIQETSNFCQGLGSEFPLGAEPVARTAVRKSGVFQWRCH